MRLKPIINKESFIAASLYDIIHIPASPYTIAPHVFYTISLSKPLHIAYLIERHKLWSALFLELIGKPDNQTNKDKVERINEATPNNRSLHVR
jgi:hypothetical protein